MTWLKAIKRELLGLFIDDNRLAVLIVGWIAVVAVMAHGPFARFVGSGLLAVALFAGLAVLLVESVLRGARPVAKPGSGKAGT